jgi:hypothetical protein
MCPACLASLALVITGIVSAGGVGAATAKLLAGKKAPVGMIEGNKREEKRK